MEASTYKLIHLTALTVFFFSLGGLTLGARTALSRNFPYKKLYSILHGLGLFALLVSGFGMLAKINGNPSGFPGWVIVKIIIWLFLGALLSPILRKPQMNRIFWVLILLLGFIAAYMAIYKPF